jgi:[protein-PII] uridylyltransferase
MIAEKLYHSDDSYRILVAALDGNSTTQNLKDALRAADENLQQRFLAGESVAILVPMRAAIVDRVLRERWGQANPDLTNSAAVIAVGGYGRGELHPGSDVDIMILVDDALDAGNADDSIAAFFTSLWDVGLDIGHSVRSVAECAAEASRDISIATTLLESRVVTGPKNLFVSMNETLSASGAWPSREFFDEKRKEQEQRHHLYENTAYQLEPNVKGSPGGLRDIQMIGWVAKRHFGVRTLDELVAHKFLTLGQLKLLKEGELFLWRVRFGLHFMTGRCEDRLLFDHQSRLAKILGYQDASYTLAVEQFMQRYYRTVMDLSRLNEMLLQLFEEAILLDANATPTPINDRFEVKNGFLQTTSDAVFSADPSALLELFNLLQTETDIRGVSAYTVGQIRRNLHFIDEDFRQNPRNHRLFLSILRAPTGMTHGLRKMNLYGVLGLYIPSFGRIVGRMQYDLFHAYTVDQHTLFVVNNLCRFALTRYDHEYPHCSPLMQSFEKPEIAYLAGLFHDIAKGRGGDHSELGAIDAESFCLEHGLSQYEAGTVAWLVRHHLALSMTAQKKDIGDPDVINEFAALIRDQMHLDYLYVLTVADVKATNPRLWNSWKASLFRELYLQTTRALRRGLESPIERDLLISETQVAARRLLAETTLNSQAIEKIWELFTDDYFLRYRSNEIAWHTTFLVGNDSNATAGLLNMRLQAHGDGIEAVLYTPRTKRTFAMATGLLAQLGMTIADVRIVPLANGYSLDTYVFMELDLRTRVDSSRLSRIQSALTKILAAENQEQTKVTRSPSRQARVFTTKSSVNFNQDETNNRTVMELVTGDRPGLLSTVGRLFIELDIDIDTAKILTIGEKAEDVFYISDMNYKPLDDAACDNLRERIMGAIIAEA